MKVANIILLLLASIIFTRCHKGGIQDVLEHIRDMAQSADAKYEAESRKILRSIKHQKHVDEDIPY
jgi:hypothetical protein